MNTPPSSGIRPTRRARVLRKVTFVIAALVTLVAAFYIVENWRGSRAWAKSQREAKARGEQLDWAAYLPARVPDEQNFLKTPFLEAVVYKERGDTNISRIVEEARKHLIWDAWVDWHAGRRLDWPQFQTELRGRKALDLPPLPRAPAADLLEALRGIEPRLEELRVSSLKPRAQFDIDRSAPFEESPSLNFVAVRSLSQIFAYHACAELALGHPDKAFVDVRVIHRFSESLKDENTLVAFMIRVALQGLALDSFWEGWAGGRWTDRQLADFQEILGRVNLLPEFTRSLYSERAAVNAMVEKYGLRGKEFWRVTMRGEPEQASWEKLGWTVIPRGWICQNLVSYNERMQAFAPSGLRSNPPTVSPGEVNDLAERLPEQIPNGPYGWLSQMAIPNFTKALQNVVRIQTFVNEAGIACALERCRRSRGEYPESLAELTPQFMEQVPAELITGGGALKYRRTADGKFLLYSVGWNETDDGGISAVTDTPPKPDFTRGDWVWRHPVQK